jgi:hypothetical protein
MRAEQHYVRPNTEFNARQRRRCKKTTTSRMTKHQRGISPGLTWIPMQIVCLHWLGIMKYGQNDVREKHPNCWHPWTLWFWHRKWYPPLPIPRGQLQSPSYEVDMTKSESYEVDMTKPELRRQIRLTLRNPSYEDKVDSNKVQSSPTVIKSKLQSSPTVIKSKLRSYKLWRSKWLWNY